MNIGQLLRAVIGDVTPGDPKTLELKIGEVVKGLVLKLLSDQDAMVNIGGTVVRARLETPLRQGQVTFLQVQPESTSGQILLKPLADSDIPMPGEGAALLLKNLALPDRPDTRQAVQLLHLEGAPVTKETIEGFARILQQKPAGIAVDEWKTAAMLAVKKNLPLTSESVSSLRSALFEPPVHQAASDLAQHLSRLLSDAPALTEQSAEIVRKLIDGIAQLRGQAADLIGPLAETDPQPAQATTDPASSLAVDDRPQETRSEQPLPPLPVRQSPVALASTQTSMPPAATTSSEPSGSRSLVEAALPAQSEAVRTAYPLPADAIESSEPELVSDRQAAGKEARQPRQTNIGTVNSDSTDGREQQQARPTASGLLPGLLKLLGVDHEQKWSRLLQDHSGAPQDAEIISPSAPSADDSAGPSDSIKSLLLQLASSDEDVPQPIKDSAQQLAQSLTGTQLLLSPDRTSAFTQVTMTVPLMLKGGEQTAAIHIQSRTGKRGELDANNCRLLFDLQMKTMGLTLVDVRVVDRLVSLEVRNDQEGARGLIDGYRDEIAGGLKAAGYQLASLKSLPFPEEPQAAGDPAKASPSGDGNRIASRYQTKPYKGMDIRV